MANPSIKLIIRRRIVAETRTEYYVLFENSAEPTEFIRPRWLATDDVDAVLKKTWKDEKSDKDFLGPVPVGDFHDIKSAKKARRLLRQIRGFFSPYGRLAWARTSIEDQQKAIENLMQVVALTPSDSTKGVHRNHILIACYMAEKLIQWTSTSPDRSYEPAFVDSLRRVGEDHQMAFAQNTVGVQGVKGKLEFATPQDAQVATQHGFKTVDKTIAVLFEESGSGVLAEHLKSLKVCFVPRGGNSGSTLGTRMPIPLSKLFFVQKHHPLSETTTPTEETLVTAYEIVDYMPHKLYGACLLWVLSIGGLSHNALLNRLAANGYEVERSAFRYRRLAALRILDETRKAEYRKYSAILNLKLDDETASVDED